MEWYNYLAAFGSGLFIANFVPHFVKGISGDAFPTPFANPPGKGLSSPIINTYWGLGNLVVGYLLFRAGNLCTGDTLALILFFAGFSSLSIMCSMNFTNKDKA